MKTRTAIKFMAIAMMLMAGATTMMAQSKSERKAAKKQAKEQMKDGWKTNPGQLTIEEQILQSKPILQAQAEWVTGEAMSTGTYYDAARSNALMQAKVNLAKVVESSVIGTGELLTGNQQEGKGEATSAGKYKEVARSKFANTIQRPQYLMDCYRNLKNGNVEVLIRIAIPYDEAKEGYEKLMKELEEMAKKEK